MIVSLEVGLASLAALFAYLSWRRASIGNTFEREEVTRNRLKDAVQVSDYYHFQVPRLQIVERSGWRYKIVKYLPIIGGIRGEALAYIHFSAPQGKVSPQVHTIEEICSHPRFEELPISRMRWMEDVESIADEYLQLEVILTSVDPSVIHQSIQSISSIMLELHNNDG